MATLINEIKSLNWQPERGNIGGVVEDDDDINQCILTILTTQKGSVPHNPEFGSNVDKYLDLPADEAIPNIIRESVDAIKTWETRITVEKVTAEAVENTQNSNYLISVYWKYNESTEVKKTEVNT